jgi:ubiquinone/menaquinone biosynthesis C-methylase UbiE
MKHWARKSKHLIIAFKIYQNWQMRRRFASGNIETTHGSSHSSKGLDDSLDYIDEQFSDYLNYGQLTTEQLRGKRILELGFGDNVGVALRFLAAGASSVVCLDKFYSKRDVIGERKIYAGLRGRLSYEEKKRFGEAIEIAGGVRFNEKKLSCINGLDLEAAAEKLPKQEQVFDIIISRAVIEEIYEPDRVFAVADRLLAPGGLMLHKIDLSDYGIFAGGGMHPLTFLTISDSVYRMMASDSGIPNRKLIGYYRRKMGELGYHAKFFITGLVGHGPIVPHKEPGELNGSYLQSVLPVINEIRAKLSREYRDLPDDELMVSGVFLAARKPGGTID